MLVEGTTLAFSGTLLCKRDSHGKHIKGNGKDKYRLSNQATCTAVSYPSNLSRAEQESVAEGLRYVECTHRWYKRVMSSAPGSWMCIAIISRSCSDEEDCVS